GPLNNDTFYGGAEAGCGLAREGPDAWKTIVEVSVLGLELRPKASIAYVVFLDADKHRVRPDGRNVSFEMEFRSKRKGKLRLDAGQQREGVYKLKLPGNRPSKPCKMHLFVRIDNGTEVVEEWLDDWLRLC
ncbi:MAG: hypothetical protein ACPG4T_16905, partial [Nannocystaceae bacterium]